MLTRRLLRVAAAMTAVGIGVVLLFDVTILDSRYAARRAMRAETTASPAPGAQLVFSATAYCKGTTTAAGVRARAGIVAADPDIFPLGSVIRVDSLDGRYEGIYTVLDTGPMVQGRDLDVYMWKLLRGARVRTSERQGHDPAARMESARDCSGSGRPAGA